MSMTPIVGFAPDSDPTLPGILTDCANLIPSDVGMTPAPIPAHVGIDALPSGARGSMASTKLNGARVCVVGTANHLYMLSSYAWVEADGALSFELGESEQWSFAQLGDSSVAASITSGMLLSNGADFAVIEDAPKAKILVSLKGFVMAFNTADATYGDSPDRWWCSAYLNVTDWAPDVATLCTTGRLVESGGEITAAERLGDDVVVYKRRSTFVGRYTGPAEVWNFTMVDSSVGCVGPKAVCDTGKAHYFLGDDDIYAFDGAQVRSLGRGIVRDWYVSNRDPKHIHKSQVFWDKQRQLAWFFFPSTASNGSIDTALVYHPATGKWGRSDSYITSMIEFKSPAATYDSGSDIISTYEVSPSIDYDSPFWTESQQLMAGFDADGRIVTFSGSAADASFTTGDFGDDDAMTTCERVTLRVKKAPSSATAIGYTKDDGGGSVQQASTAIRDDAAFDMRQRGRWHRFKIDTVGDCVVMGINVSLKATGYR
jgi:hypothetical protein